MGRGRGRPTITARIPFSKILKAYEVYGTITAVAEVLGVHRSSVRRALEENGVQYSKIKSEHRRYKPRQQTRYGKFANWLLEHSDVPLPPSNKAIAELSGCSTNTVACYFYRERKVVRERLQNLPNIIPFGALLEGRRRDLPDAKLVLYNTRSLEKYVYDIEPYSLEVSIFAQAKNGDELVFQIPDLDLFEKAIDRMNKASSIEKKAVRPSGQES